MKDTANPPGEVSSMKLNKSNCCCCVDGCNSLRRRNPELSFHSFPRPGQKVYIYNELGVFEVDRRRLWEVKVRKKETKQRRVCSRHFRNEDFFHSGSSLWSGRKFLLSTAVPTLNLPERNTETNNEVVVCTKDNNQEEIKVEDELVNQRTWFNCTNEIEKYKCKTCPNFQTNFFSSLKCHIRNGHTSENENSEELCGTTNWCASKFKEKSIFKNIFNSKLEDIQWLQSEHCSSKFRSENGLNN